MSKAVRWQVPFVSVSGTKYRVDIYDETGSWSGVTQLLAGDQPFVTDEDASDDYFAPVRSQSGTLQVCTKIEPQTTYPSGGTLSLNDILPDNNIAHPVRLVSIAANNAETIEWQGFLSCEAYSQDYTGIPQNLSLSLISVLEAMDSVHITTTNFTGAKRGNILLYYTLKKIETDCGLTCFANVAYSYASWRILQKYFDTDLFFETKEQINGGTTNYILEGMSCKELLNRLCTFMGWVAREQGTTVYFQRIGEEVGLYRQTLEALGDDSWESSRGTSFGSLMYLSTYTDWRGTGHQRSVLQGAKSVEVVAKVENFDVNMDLPNFPGVDPTESMSIEAHKSSSEIKYIENILEQSTTAVSIMTFGGYYYSKCVRPGSGGTYQYLGTSTQSDFISNSFLRGRAFYVAYDVQAAYRYSGATFVRYALKDTQSGTANKFESGMYCVLLPGISDTGMDPIFKIKNPNPVSLYRGTLTINSAMLFLGICQTRSWLDNKCLADNISSGPMGITPTIRLKLRIGSQWWNGSAFTSTEASFEVTLEGSGFNIEIPVTSNIYGEMELSVMPVVSAGPETASNGSQLMEIIMTSLSANFEAETNIYNTDSKENHYLQILSTNFRDDITINTEFATNHNNIASPSLVMNDYTATDDSRYTETILYKFALLANEEYRRPEEDLLTRLAAYYGAARKRLELEMAHPTTAPLPNLVMRGVEGVGNYLPLSESRDWQTGVCKLTCFETPT